MPEQPESPAACAMPKPSLRRRIRAWALVLVVFGIPLGMVSFAVTLIRSALRTGTPLDGRVFRFLGAAALLYVPAKVVWVYIQRRWTTGRWTMTTQARAQAMQERVQRITQCSTRRVGATRTPPWSWVLFAVKWANYSALEPAVPLWQRSVGWMLLGIAVAVLLGLTGFGVICLGAGFGTIGSGGLPIVGIGVLMFVFPGQAVWFCIRRKRESGSIRVSREELLQMRAQSTAWRTIERQKPLRSKIITSAVLVAILCGWWIRVALRHSQKAHDSWFGPGLWTLIAIYVSWDQFRKPKSAAPQGPDPSVG
jgi:hypothetical protein